MPMLLDVQSESDRDPLIPYVVWQSLHPLLDDRPGEVARWLDRSQATGAVFRGLLPRLIDKLMANPRADAKLIARVLFSGRADEDSSREAFDVVATRLRDRGLPPEFDRDLRGELKKRLVTLTGGGDHRLRRDYWILLAYCGDRTGLMRTRDIAGSFIVEHDLRLRQSRPCGSSSRLSRSVRWLNSF